MLRLWRVVGKGRWVDRRYCEWRVRTCRLSFDSQYLGSRATMNECVEAKASVIRMLVVACLFDAGVRSGVIEVT